VIKNNLRTAMRENTETSEESFRKIGLDFFNRVLGSGEKSEEHWLVDMKVMLQVKFPSALSDKERAVHYDLR
jgi:hypothetical protein